MRMLRAAAAVIAMAFSGIALGQTETQAATKDLPRAAGTTEHGLRIDGARTAADEINAKDGHAQQIQMEHGTRNKSTVKTVKKKNLKADSATPKAETK